MSFIPNYGLGYQNVDASQQCGSASCNQGQLGHQNRITTVQPFSQGQKMAWAANLRMENAAFTKLSAAAKPQVPMQRSGPWTGVL